MFCLTHKLELELEPAIYRVRALGREDGKKRPETWCFARMVGLLLNFSSMYVCDILM